MTTSMFWERSSSYGCRQSGSTAASAPPQWSRFQLDLPLQRSLPSLVETLTTPDTACPYSALKPPVSTSISLMIEGSMA
ncbi:MAG: hypothetical protein IPM94_10725 [bacterium]|nr:hypothetical protein [bacterium]